MKILQVSEEDDKFRYVLSVEISYKWIFCNAVAVLTRCSKWEFPSGTNFASRKYKIAVPKAVDRHCRRRRVALVQQLQGIP